MLKEIDDKVEAQEQDETQLTESELRNRVKKWLYKRESEEGLEKEGESGEVLADTFLQAKKGMKGENNLAKLFTEGFDKLAAGAARGIDNAGNAIKRAVEGGSEKAGAAISKLEHQKEEHPDAKEQGVRQEKEIEEVLGDIFGEIQSQSMEPSKIENEVYSEHDEYTKQTENSESELGEKKKNIYLESNLKETINQLELRSGEPKEKPKLINPKFLEMMKEYFTRISKKAYRGFKITNLFKDWIKDRPSIDSEKYFEYCDYFEGILEKYVVSNILFSDKGIKSIAREITNEAGVLVYPGQIQSIARKYLPNKVYGSRFPAKYLELEERMKPKKKSKIYRMNRLNKYQINSDQLIPEKPISEESLKKKSEELTEEIKAISPELIENMAKFVKITGKRAAVGIKFTKGFKNWIESQKSISIIEKKQLVKEYESIQEKIRNEMVDLIQNSKKTQPEIAEHITKTFGIPVTANVVRPMAKKILPSAEYSERFPAKLPLNDATRRNVEGLIVITNKNQKEIAEIIKMNGGSVHVETVMRIGREILPKNLYNIRFGSTTPLNDQTVKAVEGQILFSNRSSRKIAKYLTKRGMRVGRVSVGKIAKKILSTESYRARFEVRQLLDKETKTKLVNLILNSGFNIEEIAEIVIGECGKGSRATVQRVAKEILSVKKYEARFPLKFDAQLGLAMHPVLEDLLIEVMRNKGIRTIKEKKINENSKKRADNLIIVDTKFREIFPEIVPPKIKRIIVDYSLDTTQRNFVKKCIKEYHTKDTMFIFVPISDWKESSTYITPPVPYPENIKVVPYTEFPSFFNFNKPQQQNFFGFIDKVFKIKRSRDRNTIKSLTVFHKGEFADQKLITEFDE